MEIIVEQLTPWSIALDAARNTVSKEAIGKEPSDKWIKRMCLAEHSPIRNVLFKITLKDIPYWISVHLVRHKFGVEHFVTTQRDDRTGVSREDKRQDAPVTHVMVANAQALISISRKRLCLKAHPDTMCLWSRVAGYIDAACKPLGECLVPECVYRGFCPEDKPCARSKMMDSFENNLRKYRSI